ncbi:MAG: efflux RND transporter periplasmic adaptor subunit, partial [Pseudomonadales bacterium]
MPTPFKPTAQLSAILTAALLLTACNKADEQVSRKREPVKVIATPVELNTQLTRVEVVGTSRARQSVVLHPASAGEIVKINFRPGETVNAGDVLVELDQRKERLAVELARHRLTEAERLFERYRKSAETGATLPTTLDTAQTELEAARIALGQAEIALEDRNVIAPFSGHVGITEVDPGDRVQLDTPITTLDNRESLLVTFELPELIFDHINKGARVAMQTWEQPARLAEGEIIEIDSRVDPALRTFLTRAVVENTSDRLRPGMSFRVTLDIPGDPYPVMPEIAVQWGADGAYVWKIVDGAVQRIPIKIIQRQQGRVM